MVSQLISHAAAASGDSAPAAAAEALSALAQAAQLTIAQVGELFLSAISHGGSRGVAAAGSDVACLLQHRCREEEADYSELLFGGRTNASGVGGNSGAAGGAAPEADAWRLTNRGVVERLAALSSGQVEHACVGWLRAVAEDFSAQSPRLLAGLSTAAALVEVEAQVRGAIATWQHPGFSAAAGVAARNTGSGALKRARINHHHSSGSLSSPMAVGAATQPPTPGSATAAATASIFADADAAHHLGSWESVADWVVGRQLNVWHEVFHQPFVMRSREIIEESFAAVGHALDGPLDECLRAAAEAEVEPAGCIITRAWPLEGWDGKTAGAAGNGPHGPSHATSGLVSHSGELRVGGEAVGVSFRTTNGLDAAANSRAYRQQVSVIQRKFDEDLQSILQVCSMRGPRPPIHKEPRSGKLLLGQLAAEVTRGAVAAGASSRRSFG